MPQWCVQGNRGAEDMLPEHTHVREHERAQCCFCSGREGEAGHGVISIVHDEFLVSGEKTSESQP